MRGHCSLSIKPCALSWLPRWRQHPAAIPTEPLSPSLWKPPATRSSAQPEPLPPLSRSSVATWWTHRGPRPPDAASRPSDAAVHPHRETPDLPLQQLESRWSISRQHVDHDHRDQCSSTEPHWHACPTPARSAAGTGSARDLGDELSSQSMHAREIAQRLGLTVTGRILSGFKRAQLCHWGRNGRLIRTAPSTTRSHSLMA